MGVELLDRITFLLKPVVLPLLLLMSLSACREEDTVDQNLAAVIFDGSANEAQWNEFHERVFVEKNSCLVEQGKKIILRDLVNVDSIVVDIDRSVMGVNKVPVGRPEEYSGSGNVYAAVTLKDGEKLSVYARLIAEVTLVREDGGKFSFTCENMAQGRLFEDNPSTDSRNYTIAYVCIDNSGRDFHKSMAANLSQSYLAMGIENFSKISPSTLSELCSFVGEPYSGSVEALGPRIADWGNTNGEGLYLYEPSPTMVMAVEVRRTSQ